MQNKDSSTPPRVPNPGAIILCGGQSSRMGRNKAELIVQEQSLLESVITRVSSITNRIVVVGDVTSRISAKFPDVLFARDEVSGRGPLEGIRVGISTLSKLTETAFVTGCDAPLIEPALILYLAKLIQGYEAIMPVEGSRIFGMTAVYRTDVAEKIEEQIRTGNMRVKSLADRLKTRLVPIESLKEVDPQLNSFLNINTPADYEALLQKFASPSPED